ncbi:hypothetical protein NC653_036338 [Populus alba x Populus x berolinensis]|uniref:Uncharacterized protein n=1 Tax=Populus alba x Populus x berolinensis TaxID=444605 RepID=A0AAD6PUR8_9ROSI|nr:hypothetical protein NC653_036338 [Populus alba x Populus x berolinensis]
MGQTKPSPSKVGLLKSLRLVTTNIYGMAAAAAAAVGVYCASRNAADIGSRYGLPLILSESCDSTRKCSVMSNGGLNSLTDLWPCFTGPKCHDMRASHCSLSAELTNLFHVQKTMALLTSKPNQKSNQEKG